MDNGYTLFFINNFFSPAFGTKYKYISDCAGLSLNLYLNHTEFWYITEQTKNWDYWLKFHARLI